MSEVNLAGLCKGSTADSDSVCEGSNPSPAAKSPETSMFLGFLFELRFTVEYTVEWPGNQFPTALFIPFSGRFSVPTRSLKRSKVCIA